jgi:hypothetical protein
MIDHYKRHITPYFSFFSAARPWPGSGEKKRGGLAVSSGQSSLRRHGAGGGVYSLSFFIDALEAFY